MWPKNSAEGEPSALLKMFLRVLRVDDALVQVHGAARLLGHRLRHEGGIHLVAQRRLARGALEQKRLVGKAHGIAVQQVDFHLRRAGFMDQRVDLDVLRLAERVHVVEQRIELVDGGDAVRLAADFRAARAAHRRLQGIVGIDVRFDQEELQFRRHHRLPAMRLVQIEHPPQHIARRHGDGAAVAVKAIVDHLRGGLGGPGHHAHRLRIRLQARCRCPRGSWRFDRPDSRRSPSAGRSPPAGACPPLRQIFPQA